MINLTKVNVKVASIHKNYAVAVRTAIKPHTF
jgi:hypothetical protein